MSALHTIEVSTSCALLAEVRAGADVNIVNDRAHPPRTAMDLAAAAKRGDLVDTLRRAGGRHSKPSVHFRGGF